MASKMGLLNFMMNTGDEIDWGVAPPRPTIRPGGGQQGGWPTNPKGGVIGRGGKQVPVGKPGNKPKGGNSNKFVA
jgi:hypothetical protein